MKIQKRRFNALIVTIFLLPAILGCGLGTSEEECFERLGIPYNGSVEMKEKANVFCRQKGFDKASLIDGNGIKILTICCEKD